MLASSQPAIFADAIRRIVPSAVEGETERIYVCNNALCAGQLFLDAAAAKKHTTAKSVLPSGFLLTSAGMAWRASSRTRLRMARFSISSPSDAPIAL